MEWAAGIPLPATEWRILYLLVANAGWVVPPDRIAARIWGRDDPGDPRALRVFIRRIRAKVGDDAAAPRYIETIRGLGYRLLPADSGDA